MHKREFHDGKTMSVLLASVPWFTMCPERIFSLLMDRCRGQEQEQEAAQAFSLFPQAQTNLVSGHGNSLARSRSGRNDSSHTGSGKGGGKGQGKGACHKCGSPDHWASKWPSRVPNPADSQLPEAPKDPGSSYNGRPCVHFKLAGRPANHWYQGCEHWKKWDAELKNAAEKVAEKNG
uniref:Uncharacterized protein n=1 Tax=Eutreptiella gymnastica TaxID=73025 RepID=A0A7S1NBP3_9EUGL|mmetsp:Transcript_147366/g.257582  ORF Transcript_147366/g.257582 Transcript_147366/m.257582 type:complete len:177 (+) Transcript_147366:171-701(+)